MIHTTQTWKIGDCLELLPEIETGSINMILCDLPYGTTACSWDTIIPFDPLWVEWKRIITDNGAIVLTATQPFTSILIMSNLKMFKYCWVWDKMTARGHLVAKIRPMQQTEDIAVFGKNKINYYPIMKKFKQPMKDINVERSRTSIMGGKTTKSRQKIERKYGYPKTILKYSNASRKDFIHPTQKPVALFEYLIKTYTHEGDTVHDSCLGSGTTLEACRRTNRNCIGFEISDEWEKHYPDRAMSHTPTLQSYIHTGDE